MATKKFNVKTSKQLTTTVDLDVGEILQNLPECMMTMRCIDWKYDDCVFQFEDMENGEKLTLTRDMAEEGLQKLLLTNFVMHSSYFDPEDLGSYDAEVIDCMVQYGLFGEVIYG